MKKTAPALLITALSFISCSVENQTSLAERMSPTLQGLDKDLLKEQTDSDDPSIIDQDQINRRNQDFAKYVANSNVTIVPVDGSLSQVAYHGDIATVMGTSGEYTVNNTFDLRGRNDPIELDLTRGVCMRGQSGAEGPLVAVSNAPDSNVTVKFDHDQSEWLVCNNSLQSVTVVIGQLALLDQPR